MKKIIFILMFLASFSVSAAGVTQCYDPNDLAGDMNLLMVRKTSEAYKLLALTIGGEDYLPNGSIYCNTQSGRSGPIGGIRGGKELTCNLPDGSMASVHFLEPGPGSVAIFKDDKMIGSFSDFECE